MTIPEETTSLTIKMAGKLVNYFGLPVYVPKGYKWIAMDQNGFIYAYTHKPNRTSRVFCLSDESHCLAVQLGQVLHYEGNWTHSCVKVKHLPKVKSVMRT